MRAFEAAGFTDVGIPFVSNRTPKRREQNMSGLPGIAGSACAAGLVVLAACSLWADPPDAESLRLNHLQVIGTHNSYHIRPPDEIMRSLAMLTDEVAAWDYTHAPLDVQLDRGVRSFELDLHIFEEGFEVMHVPVVDAGSTCPFFSDCLQVVRAWSDRHPGHIPISFLLEFKEEETFLAGRPVLKRDAAMLERLEAEILQVFPRKRIITPDDVRGEHPTLMEAVKKQGWPTLDAVRGKVFFIVHDRGSLRASYTEGRDSLQGRLMFVNSSEGRNDLAFIVLDHPGNERIPVLARKGVMIRTRTDAGLREAREGDTRRRDVAMAGAAHILSTNYPPGQAHPQTGYQVSFGEGMAARCNPLTAPPHCADPLEPLIQPMPISGESPASEKP